jgi:hypothetical protein
MDKCRGLGKLRNIPQKNVQKKSRKIRRWEKWQSRYALVLLNYNGLTEWHGIGLRVNTNKHYKTINS